MNISPPWQYDEMKQIGKDYDSLAEVEAYDARHAKFRDVEKENDDVLKTLDIRKDHVAIEFGTGTGAFARQAARSCTRVYAVDVSRTMLAYAEMKAEAAGIRNITFCHAGFLTYAHAAEPVDAIVTNTAFHHLPDFWKGMALLRMNGMLKPDGRLYLSDVVFTQDHVYENIERWIKKLEQAAGPEIRKDVEVHVRQEYSTFDWILDGLLVRAKFEILRKTVHEGVVCRYLCRKTSDTGTGE